MTDSTVDGIDWDIRLNDNLFYLRLSVRQLKLFAVFFYFSENHIMNTIIIGGGQAGITLSYFLQQRGVEHLVLERDRAFSAWHNCWDSFRLNTANWMNTLPGMQKPFAPQKAWYDTATREEALDYFCAYRQMVNPH